MLEEVKKRLESFGYSYNESDSWVLGFVIEKVINVIKAECNVSEVPEGLEQIAIDMVCGEFLFSKKQFGQLTDYDFEAIAKSVKDGDTTVTFAIGEGNSTPEQRFNSAVQYLMTYGKSAFASHRCIKW